MRSSSGCRCGPRSRASRRPATATRTRYLRWSYSRRLGCGTPAGYFWRRHGLQWQPRRLEVVRCTERRGARRPTADSTFTPRRWAFSLRARHRGTALVSSRQRFRLPRPRASFRATSPGQLLQRARHAVGKRRLSLQATESKSSARVERRDHGQRWSRSARDRHVVRSQRAGESLAAAPSECRTKRATPRGSTRSRALLDGELGRAIWGRDEIARWSIRTGLATTRVGRLQSARISVPKGRNGVERWRSRGRGYGRRVRFLPLTVPKPDTEGAARTAVHSNPASTQSSLQNEFRSTTKRRPQRFPSRW